MDKEHKKKREYMRRWYARNLEHAREMSRKYSQKHKEANKQRSRRWNKDNAEYKKARDKKYAQGHKKEIQEHKRHFRQQLLDGYGGKCQCPGGCDITEPEFLTIDHIYRDGQQERKKNKGSYAIYKRLITEEFPKDRYRLLCHNCNSAKRYGRLCPHERKH